MHVKLRNADNTTNGDGGKVTALPHPVYRLNGNIQVSGSGLSAHQWGGLWFSRAIWHDPRISREILAQEEWVDRWALTAGIGLRLDGAMKTFSKLALKELRKQAGLSHGQLEVKSGVSSNAIVKLEYGYRKDPQASTLARLAHALGCPIDDLFRDDDDSN